MATELADVSSPLNLSLVWFIVAFKVTKLIAVLLWIFEWHPDLQYHHEYIPI